MTFFNFLATVMLYFIITPHVSAGPNVPGCGSSGSPGVPDRWACHCQLVGKKPSEPWTSGRFLGSADLEKVVRMPGDITKGFQAQAFCSSACAGWGSSFPASAGPDVIDAIYPNSCHGASGVVTLPVTFSTKWYVAFEQGRPGSGGGGPCPGGPMNSFFNKLKHISFGLGTAHATNPDCYSTYSSPSSLTPTAGCALTASPTNVINQRSVSKTCNSGPTPHAADSFLNILRFPTHATACSSDFSRIDGCHNYTNPPVPSIKRIGLSPLNDNDPHVTLFPEGTQAPSKPQVMNYARATNDGRLVVTTSGMSDLHFRVFRPEALAPGLKGGVTPSYSRIHGIHPLVFNNPWTSQIPQVNADGITAQVLMGTYHFNLCDDSGSAAGVTGQISQTGRNPISCRAREKDTDPWIEGDCYNITLGAHMHGAFLNPTQRAWELRSADLTVFVSKPKTLEAGEQVFTYPRLTPPLGTNAAWDLPSYEPYNLHAAKVPFQTYGLPGDWNAGQPNNHQLPWPSIITGYDHAGTVVSARTLCYNWTGTYWSRNHAGPKWCKFFDSQDQLVGNFRFYLSATGPTAPMLYSGWECGTGRANCNNTAALFEPSTTADGRLLVINSMLGLLYSYNTVGSCKASGWRDMYPIARMPMDSRLTKYGIVKSQRIQGQIKPFRNPSGEEIPFYRKIGGAYGWIDREGKNLFITVGNKRRNGFRAVNTLPAGRDDNPDGDPGRDYVALGAWTQGKMVTLDNGMNAFGSMSGDTSTTYNLALYSGASDYTPIRGRAARSIFSNENHFNFIDALSPTMPFDVVWSMATSNQRNSEVVFDEYMMNSAFVIAHMNSPTNIHTETPKDGFIEESGEWRYKATPVLQNSATSSTTYSPSAAIGPSELYLRGGARVEPIGQGGVLGKGVYLDGTNDHITMEYPLQTSGQEWYLGLWIDPPNYWGSPQEPKILYSFSDGAWIGISRDRLVSVDPGATPASNKEKVTPLIGLVPRSGYFHLGVMIKIVNGLKELKFVLNGTPLVTASGTHVVRTTAFNVMAPGGPNGKFIVGSNALRPFSLGANGQARPYQGWIDELRIHRLSANERNSDWFQEFTCNLALGTLVNVSVLSGEQPNTHLSDLRQKATSFGLAPSGFNISPIAVCEQLAVHPQQYSDPNDLPPQTNQRLYCANRVHRNPPSEDRCLRGKKLDPNIAAHSIQAGTPRPDFSSTQFCLSCHTSQTGVPGLHLNALTRNLSVNREQDVRRQPLNWPALLNGRWPASYPQRPSTAIPTNCSLNGRAADCTLNDWIFDFHNRLTP